MTRSKKTIVVLLPTIFRGWNASDLACDVLVVVHRPVQFSIKLSSVNSSKGKLVHVMVGVVKHEGQQR